MRLIASGVVLYLLYILYIGGDFMSGRFFSAPLIFSLVGLLSFIKRLPAPQKVAFAAVVVLTGWISPSSPITYFGSVPESESAIPAAETGIWDERQFYYESTGLFMLTQSWIYQTMFGWSREGVCGRGRFLWLRKGRWECLDFTQVQTCTCWIRSPLEILFWLVCLPVWRIGAWDIMSASRSRGMWNP